MHPAALVGIVLGGIVAALAVTGGVLYATDYGVEANVTKVDCAAQTDITVQTLLLGIATTQPITAAACGHVVPGNFVVYHLRTGRTLLYASRGGTLCYDSTAPTAGTLGWLC